MRPRRPEVELNHVPELYVDEPDQLQRLVARLRNVPRIAVDTEFVRDRQYTPVLELIQIATDELLAAVDYRRLHDIGELLGVLYDEAMLKVIHAGRQDLEIFYTLTHRVPQPLFDTQVAAAVLGLGRQLGYAGMVDRLLGITLPESQALTNWSQRPLNDEQIAYALDDVRYLLPLHDEFQRRLEATDRLPWLIDEMSRRADARRYARPDPRDVWRKVNGISRMRPLELAVLREIAAWRETVAQRHNRALPFIASDGALKRLARRQPKTLAQLRNVRGLRSWSVKKYGDEILSAIARGLQVPSAHRPQYERDTRPLTEDEAALVDVLQTWVQIRAEEQNVDRTTLATRAELRRLVIAGTNGDDSNDVSVLRGWRRDLIGEELMALVQGEASLLWNPERSRLELYEATPDS